MDIQYNHIKKIETSEILDLNGSVLIIGPAENSNLTGDIIRVKSIESLKEVFGNSELTKAAEYVYSNGVEKVYVYNTYNTENYITIANKFEHYDFNYIVPIGINIRDKFYNPVSKKNISYAEFYLDNLNKNTTSTIIMTDKHAELYYDLDDYIIEMENVLTEVKSKSVVEGTYDKWSNMIFVCNMLSYYEYSNIVLATSLSLTIPGKYPKDILGGAIYDYDPLDIRNKDIVYFKDKVLSEGTSIENLLNMRTTNDSYKSVLIDSTIKYIHRNLDLNKYIGTLLTKNTKMHIANDVKKFMDSLSGRMIKNYIIKSIEFVLTGSSVGNILIETELTPRGTFERLNVNLEV